MSVGRSPQDNDSGPGPAPSAPDPPERNAGFPIVGIGASAGGLDACGKLLVSLPANTGMAFIVIQHLDPTHDSMMVELLAGHTAMPVRQAIDRMPIVPNHVYVIPPGAYLSVDGGMLHVSPPDTPRGSRMPFDFLLVSMAEALRAHAIGIVLSGTGSDGSIGIRAIRASHGLVIAQEPGEAGFDGMPRSAIRTGAVDFVLPIAKMPEALIDHGDKLFGMPPDTGPAPEEPFTDKLSEIVELLRVGTGHDFRSYKTGTLRRRIERRMAMIGIDRHGMGAYLATLQDNGEERAQLAEDLLINVTRFFRDADVFGVLAEQVIPDIIRHRTAGQPIRIWVAGCSTGQEAYSIAMLFRETIDAEHAQAELKIFASDVDADAVAAAREGLYPESIAADVSAARLARFFVKEEHSYRVAPDLRAVVIFTVQDVLSDPPFSFLDMISCRNLLIYLRPEAQARVISLFDFALRDGGILLLGGAETIGGVDGRFEVAFKSERIYRHAGRRPARLGVIMSSSDVPRVPVRVGQAQTPEPRSTFADLCRRLVLEFHAPAAVLINRKYDCLYSLGPTGRYLRVPPGHPTQELLTMVPESTRISLRLAIHQAIQENARVITAGGRASHDGIETAFNLDVRPVQHDGEELLLVCFVDEPKPSIRRRQADRPGDVSRVAELEHELNATKTELRGAIRNLEILTEEQKAINEEAMSANEEYQSTNEELLTSKEELQSLNEELTALNSQLQETLERQRTMSNDLQNVLYSTDVATIFLDKDLNIRFFTPASKSLFSVITTDIGRPLGDLNSLTIDGALLGDARSVLTNSVPVEREVEARTGAWYLRSILPYRTQDNKVEGVVITFADITARRNTATALEVAKRQAEMANIAKSRFLAAASHDIRQPLQTLVLLHGALVKMVQGAAAQNLISRVDEALSTMSGILNSLLDINQIEAGTIRIEKTDFPINQILGRIRDEYNYHAQAKGLDFRVIPSTVMVHSDARLLEQMIRNLVANALKYTARGKVLVGCRRHGGMLRIQVHDTGIGIAAEDLKTIFEEYHQVDNPARDRNRGLGLGLSIVQSLGNLLSHPIGVNSVPGEGSAFTIEVNIAELPVLAPAAAHPDTGQPAAGHSDTDPAGTGQAGTGVRESHTGAILVIEDDPDMRALVEVLLEGEGHRVAGAPDGVAALDMVAKGVIRPDLVLADYNLPSGLNGLQAAAKLRDMLGPDLPVIILTGDISTGTLRDISLQGCVHLNKPVRSRDLTDAVYNWLPRSEARVAHPPNPVTPPGPEMQPGAKPGQQIVYVVDDDPQIRGAIRTVLEQNGTHQVRDFNSCEAFLTAYRPGQDACLVLDAYLPGMSGLELLRLLRDRGQSLPTIMITGNADVTVAVAAMKAGTSDFIEKPVNAEDLVMSVDRALEQARDSGKAAAWREDAAKHVAGLTARQREIMEMVLAGQPSKNIAADLGISQRTVENHRASIMKRTGSKSLPALARLALAATGTDGD